MEQEIYNIIEAIINEVNLDSVKGLWKGRTAAADNEWNRYIQDRENEQRVLNDPDKEVRRKAHQAASKQEDEAIATAHKVHNTKELIKKWAEKKGHNIAFTDKEESIPTLCKASEASFLAFLSSL